VTLLFGEETEPAVMPAMASIRQKSIICFIVLKGCVLKGRPKREDLMAAGIIKMAYAKKPRGWWPSLERRIRVLYSELKRMLQPVVATGD